MLASNPRLVPSNRSLAALLSGPARRAATPAAERTTLVNQGGGAYNHALYFTQLAPTGANIAMPADLDAALGGGNKTAATLDAWQKAAVGVFGSGWSWLTLAPNRSLVVTTSANQENPITKGDGIPIAGLDVWEHSYYLTYGALRADHVSALVKHNMTWTQVDANLKAARKGDADAALAPA